MGAIGQPNLRARQEQRVGNGADWRSETRARLCYRRGVSTDAPADLIAIDVGNSRVKLGRFRAPGDCVASAQSRALPIAAPVLPEPDETLAATAEELESGALAGGLDRLAVDGMDSRVKFCLASVRPSCDALVERLLRDWFGQRNQDVSLERLVSERMPIDLRVAAPARVGADRVAAAVAANRLRREGTPAIVVDLGTAITVDLVSADGAFEGGAILPGPALAARALAEETEGLPLAPLDELEIAPEAVGDATEPALEAGLFWGAVGAIRELIARQSDRLTNPPQVFLTGGAAPSVARLIGGPDYTVRHVPHLTLAGIALSAAQDKRS